MESKRPASTRAKMAVSQRAKQFMPFSAVVGLDKAIRRKEYELGLVDKKEFSEEAAEEINQKLKRLRPGDMCTVIFFSEGEYTTAKGIFKKFDSIEKVLILDEEKISTENIGDIEFE